MGSNYLVDLLFYVHALGGVFVCLFHFFFVMKMHSLRDGGMEDGRKEGKGVWCLYGIQTRIS